MLRLSVYADKHHQSFAPINIIHHVEMRMEESWVKEYIVDVDELAPPKSSAPRLKAAVLGGRHGGRGSLPPSAMAAALHAPVMLQCRYLRRKNAIRWVAASVQDVMIPRCQSGPVHQF
ncbi:hypothetical protein HPB47_015824 [Ixodes persulcatus]|uniref:Uncharacterized protein n=1 Tax=Ixodes persulcatus TaxID=34615 RepID=A0AC60QV18_IXOPE|nr:hypothetical protein HPB47_015824 [Ixodes persulcatus]